MSSEREERVTGQQGRDLDDLIVRCTSDTVKTRSLHVKKRKQKSTVIRCLGGRMKLLISFIPQNAWSPAQGARGKGNHGLVYKQGKG